MPQVTGQVRDGARDSRVFTQATLGARYSWVSEPDMYRLLQRGSYAGRNPSSPVLWWVALPGTQTSGT